MISNIYLRRKNQVKEYNMIGRDIGIVIYAENAQEAKEKAEETLMQGLGGYIEFINKEDEEEYKNIEG